MNQPTREEFDDLKEEVRKLKQQQTEPIKITVEPRKTEAEETLLQTLVTDMARANTNIGVLKQQMEEVKGDFLAFRETQADHGDMLKTMATKDDISKLETTLAEILDRLPPKS